MADKPKRLRETFVNVFMKRHEQDLREKVKMEDEIEKLRNEIEKLRNEVENLKSELRSATGLIDELRQVAKRGVLTPRQIASAFELESPEEEND